MVKANPRLEDEKDGTGDMRESGRFIRRKGIHVNKIVKLTRRLPTGPPVERLTVVSLINGASVRKLRQMQKTILAC